MSMHKLKILEEIADIDTGYLPNFLKTKHCTLLYYNKKYYNKNIIIKKHDLFR